MTRKIARYRVKDTAVDSVLEAIKEFVAAVASSEPETEYRSYRLEDGRSFLHVMAFPDEQAENRHRNAPHTLAFVRALYPSCEEEPAITTVTLVA